MVFVSESIQARPFIDSFRLESKEGADLMKDELNSLNLYRVDTDAVDMATSINLRIPDNH